MASTYVNNLRLNEMGTGDASGTWGNTTNTNLELIGEALGFGTEAITTNADTHTTTVADGASDAGRAMYLKYTGTLDSACTITIAPNTMKRMQFIENATSGSQNIIIKQGSDDAANKVTIPAGDTKAVYLDGAGSGAVVKDAFASLSVVDLKVQDDLTVTGDADIDGTLEADAITINGTAISSVLSPVAGSGSIVTTGALNSGSITSGFGTIDTGSSTITTTGAITGGSLVADNITIDGTEIDLSSGDLTVDVAGDIILNADGANILFSDDSVQYGRISNDSSNFRFQSDVSDKDIIFRGNDGGSYITALTLDMSGAGAATFNNDVTAFSDKRLKTDIKPITNSLDKVMQMQGVYYKRNDVEDAREQVGVLAQDMEAILPEVVITADDEIQTKSVDYGKITSVLIEAIKELKKEINELKGV